MKAGQEIKINGTTWEIVAVNNGTAYLEREVYIEKTDKRSGQKRGHYRTMKKAIKTEEV